MTLIKSISGIRGTIGGVKNENLTPIDIVESTAGFAQWILKKHPSQAASVIIGRDGRISGNLVSNLVTNTLMAMGISVIDLGLTTTPTVEMAVILKRAQAGIIVTASHNPMEWNALKFVNDKGEFISAEDGEEIIKMINNGQIEFANIHNIGSYIEENSLVEKHIDAILALDIVNIEKIKEKQFKIVVDTINSSGAIVLPSLFDKLNCETVFINDILSGIFAHNPEPLPEHLEELSSQVVANGAELGISVDPDVDRLAFVCEDGRMFGEEYTLVAIADYVLGKTPGSTVSNLSSTRALRDVTESHDCQYFASSVGEVNVVAKMKEVNAVIGGEGNGGIIYPTLHYGRDAVLGIVLFLNLLAETGLPPSELKMKYPKYALSKNKIALKETMDVDAILSEVKTQFVNNDIDDQDGIKIYFDEPVKQWVHLRKSNTEPIIRIYSESTNKENADALGKKFVSIIEKLSI